MHNQASAHTLLAFDITDRKELQRQLRQQERLAAVGQLAAGIAHDFRNLLSTIILYAELSQRAPGLPKRESGRLQVIADESRKAAELVEQILDFSNRSMIDRQPVDLHAFVEERMRVYQRTIPENIRIALAAPEAPPEAYVVEVDLGRIQQVLINLVLNARDAMPDGGELRFTLSRTVAVSDKVLPADDASSGDWVCLNVSDTGIGMTEEVQARIFEPFFTTKGVGAGSPPRACRSALTLAGQRAHPRDRARGDRRLHARGRGIPLRTDALVMGSASVGRVVVGGGPQSAHPLQITATSRRG